MGRHGRHQHHDECHRRDCSRPSHLLTPLHGPAGRITSTVGPQALDETDRLNPIPGSITRTTAVAVCGPGAGFG